MGSHFIRDLLPASSNVTLPEFKLNTTLDNCLQYCKDIGVCHPLCLDCCSAAWCQSDRRISRHKKLLIAIILVTGIASFLFCCYAMYVKYFGKSTSRSPQEEQRFETHDEFVDEDHGPVVDHPIWHIRTVGLQPSVISSIGVCKYKRGDGLVEGTDCAVCLTEFDEDETLRLLPNCNHAFHIRCIDTWLGSHTSCPLCRAPVVTNTAAAASSEEAIGNTSGEEENRTPVLDDIEESDTEIEPGDGEIRTGTEEEGGMQATRRSVSLDSLSASKISQALFNVLPMETHRNSATTRRPLRESGPNMGLVPKRLSRNQSLAKFMASSSFGRSLQVGPSSLKRSFSCSGKLFLSRYNRSRSSDLPSTIVAYISLIDSLSLMHCIANAKFGFHGRCGGRNISCWLVLNRFLLPDSPCSLLLIS